MKTKRWLLRLFLTPGLMVCLAVPAATRYVWQDSPSPGPPYAAWDTAAHTIQAAVDAAVAGDTIVVTNGTYATGGRAVDGLMTNRVAVTKPLALTSVNGPDFTIIRGYQLPGMTNGNGAIRCVYLTDGASLSGFTLTNGATRRSGDYYTEWCGGGLWCESTSATVSNCVVTGNSAYFGGGVVAGTFYHSTLSGNWAETYAGGAYSGTFNHCTFTNNAAATYGGGADTSTLGHCTLVHNSAAYGGGAYYCFLTNCVLTANLVAGSYPCGGGACQCTLANCALAGNPATGAGAEGGGAYSSVLYNCTLAGNSAAEGGGAYYCALTNCIAYFNTAPVGANYDSTSLLGFCCATPVPPDGGSNITADPQFVDRLNGNLRLRSNSPCINAGNNAYVAGTTDLDGNPRLEGSVVDMGANEYPVPVHLAVLPSGGAVRITLPSSPDGLYTLYRTTTLVAAPAICDWVAVPGRTNIPGTGGPLTLTDPDPTLGAAFYRVEVTLP